MEERPVALFYAGTNGSGKSTLRELDQHTDIKIHIDPDAIARTLKQRKGEVDNLAAGREAIRQFREAIETRASFSMETTLTGNSVLQRMQQAKDAGFLVELRYVGLVSADLNVQRVAERVARGGHNIPEDTIRRRYGESLENLAYAMVIAEKISISDNSGTQHIMHLIVENGNIERFAANPPQWIRDAEKKAASLLTRPDGQLHDDATRRANDPRIIKEEAQLAPEQAKRREIEKAKLDRELQSIPPEQQLQGQERAQKLWEARETEERRALLERQRDREGRERARSGQGEDGRGI